jgi:O-acetylhomoserine (thiol)-lyase
MEPGDRFVASNRLYGGSVTQFGKTFRKFDWHCDFVDFDDPDAIRKALTPKTKAIFCESLANPGGVVTDLEAVAAVAHEAGLPLIVDNTMATPYLCRPIEWGADIVTHSTTKFLSGNGTSMGGAMVDSGLFDWSATPDRFPSLASPEPAYHGLNFHESFGDMALTVHGHAIGLRDLGPTMAPMNAFQSILGIESLAMRMRRHCENAQVVAEFLEGHERVAWVRHAGLASSPYHALAKKYLENGFGAVFTFGVKGGYEAGLKVVENVELFSHLANIGDARSLILHPASTTHRQLTPEQREASGTGDDVIRLSIGVETPEDLIRDLDAALTA